MAELVLDLGCGSAKTPGALGVDLIPRARVDLAADLGQGLPFRDSCADVVVMRHLIEHVPDVTGLMREVHRVCKNGARVSILTPHYSAAAAYLDPTHRHYFSVRSFDYFCGLYDQDNLPVDFGFEMISQRLVFGRLGRMSFAAWANRHQAFYEQHLAFMFPALEVAVMMKAVKQA